MRRTVTVFLVVVALFGFVGTSRAQNKAAEEMDDQARAYYRAGAFQQAGQAFEKAFALKAKSGRLFNAGRAYEQAGDKRKASELFGRYLDREKSGDKVTEARARKAKLDTEIAEEDRLAAEASAAMEKKKQAQLHVDTAQAHLRTGSYIAAAASFEEAYQVSGNPEFLFDKAEALRLGKQRAEAIAAYRRYQREAPKGNSIAEARTLQRELENPAAVPTPVETNSVPAEALPSERSEETPADGGNKTLRITGLVVAGIGVAMLGTSGVFALKASSIESDLNGLDATQGDTWGPDKDDLFDEGQAAENTARGLAIVGGVAAIGGTVLYVLGRGDKKAPKESITLSPSLHSAGGPGFAVSGRF